MLCFLLVLKMVMWTLACLYFVHLSTCAHVIQPYGVLMCETFKFYNSNYCVHFDDLSCYISDCAREPMMNMSMELGGCKSEKCPVGSETCIITRTKGRRCIPCGNRIRPSLATRPYTSKHTQATNSIVTRPYISGQRPTQARPSLVTTSVKPTYTVLAKQTTKNTEKKCKTLPDTLREHLCFTRDKCRRLDVPKSSKLFSYSMEPKVSKSVFVISGSISKTCTVELHFCNPLSTRSCPHVGIITRSGRNRFQRTRGDVRIKLKKISTITVFTDAVKGKSSLHIDSQPPVVEAIKHDKTPGLQVILKTCDTKGKSWLMSESAKESELCALWQYIRIRQRGH